MRRHPNRYAEGQTWRAPSGASRTILALYPETVLADASVRFRDENGNERTVGFATLKTWVSVTRAVVT